MENSFVTVVVAGDRLDYPDGDVHTYWKGIDDGERCCMIHPYIHFSGCIRQRMLMSLFHWHHC